MDTRRTLQTTGCTLALALLASQAAAQEPELRPRWRAEKPAVVTVHSGSDLSEIVLKLRDDSGARVERGRLVAAPGSVTDFLESVLGLRVARLIDLDGGELTRMRREGERRSGSELCDLTQYFSVSVPAGVDALELMNELNGMDEVEEVYAAPRPIASPGPPAGTTPTGLYESSQGYRAPAPTGIDADFAESATGGLGERITIADIEFGWNLPGLFGSSTGHEDLTTIANQSPGAPVGNSSTWLDPCNDFGLCSEIDHGTAVAGIIGADDDAIGVTGIARNARFRVHATYTSNAGYRVARAIVRSAAGMQSGDVILIESQAAGPNYDVNAGGQFGSVPVEYYSAEFNAIRTVTALGIHVIEAAGNGSQHLDDYTDGPVGSGTGDPTYVVFNPYVRRSGAVLVAAAQATWNHTSMWYTNHGFCIDSFSWGENIVTLGYGDLFDGGAINPDPDRLYTQVFGGTSGASAIVASAAASIAGMHRANQRHTPIRPEALRMLLRTSGSPSTNLAGRQPDLADQARIVKQGRDPALVFDGTHNSRFGSAISSAGDVNNDGYDDLLVGGFNGAQSLTPSAGTAQVFSGLDGWLLYSYDGTASFQFLGSGVCGAGDVNSDGHDDFLIGSMGADFVRMYSGANGTALYTVSGSPGDETGAKVRSLGDLNGDGVRDFVVSAPGDATNGDDSGRVDVRSGSNGALLHAFHGSQIGERLGFSVDSAGDVNGDGYDDIIAGSSGDLAFVFSGADWSTLHSLSADNAGDRFGWAVSSAGDVDADGYDDFMVGAPRDDDNGTNSGRVRVYSGLTGGVLYTFDGPAAGDEFGLTVQGMGDLNNDGHDDFACGTPLSDLAATDAGAVWVHSGKAGNPIWTYRGSVAFEEFGRAVAPIGDLDRDGRGDLAIGSPTRIVGQDAPGRVVTFLAPQQAPLVMQPN